MLQAAPSAPVATAARMIRAEFERKLSTVRNIRLENKVDDSSPSLNFTFIREFVLGDGVYRPDAAAHEGCQSCKPNMVKYSDDGLCAIGVADCFVQGQHIGCEYPRLCECLEYAAIDEKASVRLEPERYQQFLAERERDGFFVNTNGLPKRFPYQKSTTPSVPSTLLPFYSESRVNTRTYLV